MLLDIAGFDFGIAPERVGSFGNIVVTSYIVERHHVPFIAHNPAYLFELMGIVCGEYYIARL